MANGKGVYTDYVVADQQLHNYPRFATEGDRLGALDRRENVVGTGTSLNMKTFQPLREIGYRKL